MRAEYIWALIMPDSLGQIIKTRMQQQGSDIGPILSHPRSVRWTFIIRPDLPDDVALFAEMFRLNVSIVRAGGTIALPSPAQQCVEFRRWVEPPRCTFRPSGRVVVDAIRGCAGGPGRRFRTPMSARS